MMISSSGEASNILRDSANAAGTNACQFRANVPADSGAVPRRPARRCFLVAAKSH
jgi:hypothetical protein